MINQYQEIRHFHLFCGLGGGAAGFNKGHARLGNAQAKFRCIGGIDSNPAAIADFSKLAGVPGTVMDLFDHEQYVDFHGCQPPDDWREATPADIRNAAGGERPHIVFTSPPCKGFSGLLSQSKSETKKYRALDRLTMRGIWLTMEAWADDPVEFLILENVPRIQSRGRYLLDQITGLLRQYGYAVAETTHDCGELGGLAQSRKRFLLVARHMEKVPPFLYEPRKRPLQSVGSILGRMPMPTPYSTGMHRIPSLQWKTWVRLAFVEAGSDWRSLKKLAVKDGILRDYCIVPERTKDRFTVGDPRFQGSAEYGQYGVRRWDQSIGAISGQSKPGGGRYAVADPRPTDDGFSKYAVTHWNQNTGTVISGSTTGQGAYAVADPRLPDHAQRKESKGIPDANENIVAMIRSLDNTWHRPFTTLELAALQGLIEPEEYLELEGMADIAWRERIGNAVPPPAAQAIASVMGKTLLLAWAGETFVLDSAPIWVKPMAVALTVPHYSCESQL